MPTFVIVKHDCWMSSDRSQRTGWFKEKKNIRYPISARQNKGFPAKIHSSTGIPDVPVQKGTWKESERGKRMEWKW